MKIEKVGGELFLLETYIYPCEIPKLLKRCRTHQGHAAGVLGGPQEPPDLRQEGAPEHRHRSEVFFYLFI